MRRLLMVTALVVVAASGLVRADTITAEDIMATTGNEVQAGNGLLDFILFDGSTAGNHNEINGFNGDDANTDMPGGGVTSATESFITSIGELRGFYDLTFSPGTVNDIILSVDLDEQGSSPFINLNALTVVVDFDDFLPLPDDRNDPYNHDLTFAQQNATGAGFSGGTIAAQLWSSPVYLAVNQQGAGWADYGISLGINPYDPAFTDETRILFHWSSTDHTNGRETIFLSGQYIIPEPASLWLLALCGLVIGRRKRR